MSSHQASPQRAPAVLLRAYSGSGSQSHRPNSGGVPGRAETRQSPRAPGCSLRSAPRWTPPLSHTCLTLRISGRAVVPSTCLWRSQGWCVPASATAFAPCLVTELGESFTHRMLQQDCRRGGVASLCCLGFLMARRPTGGRAPVCPAEPRKTWVTFYRLTSVVTSVLSAVFLVQTTVALPALPSRGHIPCVSVAGPSRKSTATFVQKKPQPAHWAHITSILPLRKIGPDSPQPFLRQAQGHVTVRLPRVAPVHSSSQCKSLWTKSLALRFVCHVWKRASSVC